MQLLRDQLEAEGLSVFLATPAEAAVYFDLPPSTKRGLPEQIQGIAVQLGQYLKSLDDGRLTIIHAHDAVACYGALKVGISVPIILTVHGYLANEYVAAGAIRSGSHDYQSLLAIERFSYEKAKSVIAVDARIAKHISYVSGRKAVVIHNAVNTREFDGIEQRAARQQLDFPLDKYILLCPRRLTEKNGVRFAIEALSYLGSRDNIRLVIAGDGEQRHFLEELAHHLGVQDSCVFVGSVPHQKMPLYYAASDIVLIPSVHAGGVEEATSISALEGMAASRPVIASSVGGLTEIIRSDETGFLVPPAEPGVLAQTIERLLRSETLRRTTGSAARAHVTATFGPKQFVSKVVDVYQKVKKASDPVNLEPRLLVPRATMEIDAVIKNQSQSVNAIDTLKNQGLSIAFLAMHNRLTGGAKIFFEHANQLYRRGVAVAILAHEQLPDWMTIDAPWIQLPEEVSFRALKGLFDIAVGMFWTGIPDLLRFDATAKVLLEQGDPSLFEPHLLPEQTQRVLSTCYTAPVGMITVSRKLSDVLTNQFGRQSVTIPNAIDHKLFHPVPKPIRDYFTVILVGADEMPFKGIREGLSAIEQLRNKGFPIEVVQVSPGGRTLYQTKRRIVYRPSPHRLAMLYQEADVYLGCSWYESFSLPPLEAMACGTSVVSTDNGGIRDYAVPEENCLLAPVKDPQSLAHQLERLLLDEALRHRLSVNGVNTAKHFTWDHASEAFAGALLRFAGPSLSKGALKPVPEKINRFHQVANGLLEAGNLKGAKELLRTALVLNPNEPDSLYNLAYVCSALGEDRRASGLLRQLLETNPSHPEGLALNSWLSSNAIV